MRVGLSSIVGDGFGTGSFVFGEVASGASCPAYGTFSGVATLVEYPQSEGGLEVFVSENSTYYPSQTVDVDAYHNGTCGYYYDWTTETNVAYKVYGLLIAVTNSVYALTYDINGTYYQIGDGVQKAYHDGYGSYYTSVENQTYYPYGTFITTLTGLTIYLQVPSSGGVEVAIGTFDNNYYSDGTGSVYAMMDNVSYLPYGTFLTNDGTFDYYSDGVGGYYT